MKITDLLGSENRGRSSSKLFHWLVAVAILILLALRIEPSRLALHFGAGPHLPLFLYAMLAAGLITVADAAATRVTLILCGSERPLHQLILVRGALNLAGVLHLVAVQVLMGFYLYRTGEKPMRSAALVMMLVTTQLGALILLGAGGALVPEALPESLQAFYILGVVGFAFAVSIKWIRHFLPALVVDKLNALSAFGPRALYGSILARFPHVVLLAVAPWGALWIWGVHIPFWEGLFLFPTALLVGALPLTPAGLGTTQAAMVWLFAPLLDGSPMEREALVLSAALSWGIYGLLSQLFWGILCLPGLPRDLFSGAVGARGAEP